VSNKCITHIQPSTGFGSMGPSSGRFFYIMSKRNYIKIWQYTCLRVEYSLLGKYLWLRLTCNIFLKLKWQNIKKYNYIVYYKILKSVVVSVYLGIHFFTNYCSSFRMIKTLFYRSTVSVSRIFRIILLIVPVFISHHHFIFRWPVTKFSLRLLVLSKLKECTYL
jgi:hypothetical protein